MATLTNKRPRSDSENDEIDTSTIFRTQENFAKFLIIESTNKDKPITSLSPFVIEKQIEALIGTVKSVKKLRCVNCGKDHLSRSSECEVWKKEKEIMKLKVTKNLTYPEARKLYDQQQPEFSFAKVVQSLSVKPETKTASTQYNVEDSKITESSTVIVAKKQ